MTKTNELLTATWHLGKGTRQLERLGFPLEPASSECSGIPESGNASQRELYRCMLLPHLSYSELPVQQHAFSVFSTDGRHATIAYADVLNRSPR